MLLTESSSMYPVVHVPDDANDSVEQLGTKFKFWYDNNQRLFKEGRQNSGEHWSEKACCEIARVLDLPHAIYDLAEWRERIGVVSETFVPMDGRLVLGNEVLAKQIRGYPQAKRYEAREHRLSTVLALLKPVDVNPPLGFDRRPGLMRACDYFVGYLLLDALVSNQDRHHENWGYIVMADAMVHLAPTFDHASSLGRNETDESRIDRLNTRDAGRSISHYVTRAKSAFFSANGTDRLLSTIEAFHEAARFRPHAARYWLERLGTYGSETFERIFNAMPDGVMSEAAVRFALNMIAINQRTLLDLNV